ncbi:MAG: hypothetical protein OXG35_17000, partial [Acidobacteria bacterium]|nr:hypothetical protein [Acidobacteriota bacterium]
VGGSGAICRHVHILALPQDPVVKDEPILVLDDGDRNPEFNAPPDEPFACRITGLWVESRQASCL